MLAQVQGIRCLAADRGEMTSHKSFHFSLLVERVVRSSSDTDPEAPANQCMEGITGSTSNLPVTRSNFDFTECCCKALLGGCPLLKHTHTHTPKQKQAFLASVSSGLTGSVPLEN